MMNPEIKRRWVEALRSGRFTQGNRYLKSREEGQKQWSYCCLGVLCEIEKKAFGLVEANQEGLAVDFDKNCALLNEDFMKYCQLDNTSGACVTINGTEAHLTTHNDNGCSFEEIADAIEEQL